jgi:predicted alpha/beta-fold hydrolase
LAARTIWEFDEHITAPLNGFASADDYYTRASSTRFLAGVRVSTLLLHAVDDPFLPPASIPAGPAASNPALHLVVHQRGGHVGFLAGSPRRPSFWGDEESARFLDATLTGF